MIGQRELLELADRYVQEIVGTDPRTESGERAFLESLDVNYTAAVALALHLVFHAVDPDTQGGRAAIFMQGFAFGIWLDRERLQ